MMYAACQAEVTPTLSERPNLSLPSQEFSEAVAEGFRRFAAIWSSWFMAFDPSADFQNFF